MDDGSVDRRRLFVPVAVEAVHCGMVGVFDHILYGFSRFAWIAGQARCVMAGFAVVGMAA